MAGAAVGCGASSSIRIDFSDPAGIYDAYSASIDWGDGTVDGVTGIASGHQPGHTFATAGPHTVTVTVSDEDGGTSATATQTVVVNFTIANGKIAQPVNDTRSGQLMSLFKYGSTIPVKIQVLDCNGSFPSSLGPKVTVDKLSSGTPINAELEPYSTSAADTGNSMRFTGAPDNQYIFNLASKSFASDPSSQWRIIVSIPSTGQRVWADIGLKK